MGWKIIDRLREERWVVFLFSILLLLNVGCGKKSSGGEGISNVERCPVWYKDADEDGYTDGTTKVSCLKPSDEYVSSATIGDCNDNDPNINPGKTEICDGKDNNCNGQIDEGDVCTFSKTIGGSRWDIANSIIQSSDGGYVVAGYTKSFGAGDWDFYVVKLDSSGNVLWTKTIGGSKGDGANSIVQSSDGGYVISGWTESFGAGYEDIYVVKLDSSGNVVWTKTIGGSLTDVANSIIQSSDGGYVVAGGTLSFGAGGSDMYIVKLDSSGNVVWTKTIGGSKDDVASSIIRSSDGGYVVVGYTQSFREDDSDISDDWDDIYIEDDRDLFDGGISEDRDIYVVKLDSSGNIVWTKTIGGSKDDVAYSIIQSSDRGYVVAGWTESFGAGWYDFYVVKLDSSGNVIWTKTIGGSFLDVGGSIIRSSDGGYVIAGGTASFGAGFADFYVVKLDSSGKVIWTKTIGGRSLDVANSIIQSSDGGYVVAGSTLSFGAGLANFYVVKLDSSGNVIWTKTIGGGSLNIGGAIIRSSYRGYVVTGATAGFGAGEFDFYVVKMDDNGNVCFSQNITNYSVSSNVGSFSSPSPVVISQSPRVKSISPTVSYGGSVSDVCALAKAPHLNMCSESQDCDFGSSIATNKEDVESYGCSAGGVLSRFLIPASMLIIYYRFRKKKKRKS